MPKPVLAVGVDPAKRVHRAVAVLFLDEIVLDVAVPNSLDAVGVSGVYVFEPRLGKSNASAIEKLSGNRSRFVSRSVVHEN